MVSLKIRKAQEKHPCWRPVPDRLPCEFIKMGLHKLHFLGMS